MRQIFCRFFISGAGNPARCLLSRSRFGPQLRALHTPFLGTGECGGLRPLFPSSSDPDATLAASSLEVTGLAKSFRISTYAKCTCNSRRIRTYEKRRGEHIVNQLKPKGIRTSKLRQHFKIFTFPSLDLVLSWSRYDFLYRR